MTALQTCPEKVWPSDGWSDRRPCGKPVKRDGLCGVHARSRDLAAERQRESEAQQERYRHAREVASQFCEAFGLTTLGVGWHTAEITLPIAVAERLIAERTGGAS